MELKLRQNVQFIYELALAKPELEALGVKARVEEDMGRPFHMRE